MNKNKILICTIIFMLVFLHSSFLVDSASAMENKLAPHQAGELLVKLKSSPRIYKFKFDPEFSGQDLQELMNFYNYQPQVEYVEPNYIYQASLEPLDTYYTQQFYLTDIQAHRAWNITTGDNSVTIAIIDSGVDIDHPDLSNNIWVNHNETPNNGLDDDENGYTDDVNGWDFITNTNDPRPKLEEPYSKTAINHGTAVAGVAAAQGGNNQGIAGVSWHAKIMSLRVLDGEGVGDTSTVAKAIDYARQQGAHIINLSFVGTGRSLTLENAIQQAAEAGILVVAAAGNEVKSSIDLSLSPQYPVCHDGPNGENWVIGVASIDKKKKLASFSNYGKDCIDLVAPGVTLFSTTYYNDAYQEFSSYYSSGWTGTSVSTPQVAGAVALIKSLKQNLTLKQIKDLILNNTDDVDRFNPTYKNLLGHGLLNVYAAISKTLIEKPSQPSTIKKIVSSPAKNGGPHVRIFKKSHAENQFFAFDENFRGNLSVAAGDLDNDGDSEIITGLGQGTYPWIKIFNQDGTLVDKIVAYHESFRGGVEVAVGDIDGDNQLDIIAGAGPGGGPHIRIFDRHGNLKSQFFAFDASERTGVEVAAGDVNQDGRDEIIVSRKSGSPEIRIFNYRGHQLSSFMAYDNNFTGGVHVAAGDLNGDGQDEIIAGTGPGGGPQIRTFNYDGTLVNQFFAYHEGFRGGVYVAAADVDGDGNIEILAGAGPTGGPHIRVFNSVGEVKLQFFAYAENFRGGVRVAVEK